MARKSGRTPLESGALSLGIATLWEIGDAFKPNHAVYGDWRDEFVTADGFSYSDITYHMAGTYISWLVMDGPDSGLFLSVTPVRTTFVWSF